jgi:hypothetical protein
MDNQDQEQLRNAFRLSRLARMALRMDPGLRGMLISLEDQGPARIERVMCDTLSETAGTVHMQVRPMQKGARPISIAIELGEDES